MHEVLMRLAAIRREGEDSALATVVATWQSAPQPPGASMLITRHGEAVGSVSGGCVEGALFLVGQEVLTDGIPRYETFGVSDGSALAVGLTCGGILEVFVERVDDQSWPEMTGVAESIASCEPVAVATIVRGPHGTGRHLVIRPTRTEGSLGTERLDIAVRQDAIALLASGTSGLLHYGPSGERSGSGLDVFITSIAPPPQMFICGAVGFAAALVGVGTLLGYRVTVVDARPIFATRERFPKADAVVVDWPHRWLAKQHVDERTVIAVLTHDPKFDIPALQVALRTDAGYVGAMGSRRTHSERQAQLRAAGVTDEQLARLHSPIGLHLGARTPAETAISIAAEIVLTRSGGSGRRLSETEGPIHPSGPRT